jgi:hypothetical protein
VRASQASGSLSSGTLGIASGPIQTRLSPSIPACATTASQNA